MSDETSSKSQRPTARERDRAPAPGRRARAGGRQRLLRGGRVRARALPRSPRSTRWSTEGKRGARLAANQIDHLDEYLSACQLGITLTSLGIGFLGEPAIASLVEQRARRGACPHGVTLAISFAFAYLITTALHITVGEQVPKIYAIAHAEDIARRTARLLELFRVAFKPLIVAAQHAPRTRSCGRSASTPKAEFDEASSSEDLKLLIAQSVDRRQARRGRGGHALRRLPPARAGGAPGDDADPRGGHRRRRPRAPRRRCAAASTPATRAWWSPRTATPTASAASCTTTRWPGG